MFKHSNEKEKGENLLFKQIPKWQLFFYFQNTIFVASLHWIKIYGRSGWILFVNENVPVEEDKITVAVVFHSLRQSTIHFSLTD